MIGPPGFIRALLASVFPGGSWQAFMAAVNGPGGLPRHLPYFDLPDNPVLLVSTFHGMDTGLDFERQTSIDLKR